MIRRIDFLPDGHIFVNGKYVGSLPTERKTPHWLKIDHIAFLLLPIPMALLFLIPKLWMAWLGAWCILWITALVYDLLEG